MASKNKAPETLLEAVQYFADPDLALDFVADLRWPEGEQACPRCGSVREHTFLKTRRIWKCRDCKKQFSIKVGTIFEDSPISLSKWLPAMWMLANCKNGISSYELARALGVTQKTAWFMLHRIREAMEDDSSGPMNGEVEVDEVYIGGKAKNMHIAKRKRVTNKGGITGKTAVMGMLERPAGAPCQWPSKITQIGPLKIAHLVEGTSLRSSRPPWIHSASVCGGWGRAPVSTFAASRSRCPRG
jgi:transposase-like protein